MEHLESGITLNSKKRTGGGSIITELRRKFANLIKVQTVGNLQKTPAYIDTERCLFHVRKNSTLPRSAFGENHSSKIDRHDSSHVLMTERIVLPRANSGLVFIPENLTNQVDSSKYNETPKNVRVKAIRLDALSGGSGLHLPRKYRENHGHSFCAIPLENDTFCDYCSKPIWGLGWGPVCQRCADCQMTCHWLCKDRVTVECESSPPPVRTSSPTDSFEGLCSNPPEIALLPVSESECLLNKSSSNGMIPSPYSSESSPPLSSVEMIDTVIFDSFERNDQIQHHAQSRSFSCEPDPISNQEETKSTYFHRMSLNGLEIGAALSQPSIISDNNVFPMRILEKSVQDPIPLTRTSMHASGLDGQRTQALPQTLRTGSKFSLFTSSDRSLNPDREKSTSPVDICQFSRNQNSVLNSTIYYTANKPPPAKKLNEIREHVIEEEDFANDIPSAHFLLSPNVVSGNSSLLSPSSVIHHQSISSRQTDSSADLSRSIRRHSSMVCDFSYDFSSLDHNEIALRGLCVRQLSPARDPTKPGKQVPLAKSNPDTAPPSPTKEGVALVMSSVMQATHTAAVTGHQVDHQSLNFAKVIIGPRDTLPWNSVELARRIEIFNGNKFGLSAKMTPRLPEGDCEGQIRININLIRPVRMMLKKRPTSIFDIVGDQVDTDLNSDDEEDELDSVIHTDHQDTAKDIYNIENKSQTALPTVCLRSPSRKKSLPKVSFFRLPRGSSKLLHVFISTTAQQVITRLLSRFHIDDNPQKFALYEHTIVSNQEVSVRKLFDNESPFGLLLRWIHDHSKQGSVDGDRLNYFREDFNRILSSKRLVLQENDTGDIEWTYFSEAELRNFLHILNREESDYRRRIQLKYQIRKREILRLMTLRAKNLDLIAANASALSVSGSHTRNPETGLLSQSVQAELLLPLEEIQSESHIFGKKNGQQAGTVGQAESGSIVESLIIVGDSDVSKNEKKIPRKQKFKKKHVSKQLSKADEKNGLLKKERKEWLRRKKIKISL